MECQIVISGNIQKRYVSMSCADLACRVLMSLRQNSNRNGNERLITKTRLFKYTENFPTKK